MLSADSGCSFRHAYRGTIRDYQKEIVMKCIVIAIAPYVLFYLFICLFICAIGWIADHTGERWVNDMWEEYIKIESDLACHPREKILTEKEVARKIKRFNVLQKRLLRKARDHFVIINHIERRGFEPLVRPAQWW